MTCEEKRDCTPNRASSNDGAYRQLAVYSEVLSRVRSEYVEEPNIPAVTDGALHGLLESLDANSSYLSSDEYKKYKARKAEARGDIGAAVSKRFRKSSKQDPVARPRAPK